MPVQLHTFITSVLEGCDWWDSCPSTASPWWRNSWYTPDRKLLWS